KTKQRPHGGTVIMERISAKDHGGPKWPSFRRALWASFEHFGAQRPFNTAAMIVFTPKCSSEGDISRLECT
ncbi:hypothetical protein M9458_028956, partial [Cirrhinus mrigala]